ncbi:hypothetical protein MLGJGCBP_02600 [Rhodococcus sp. T7]|uniref:Hsp70 protein n=1 Tax=Rhodococcus opacus (strain B4) TaxID=632772 RepID=C1BD22_RHOOB|nr:hypothetical protein MLGJGCBP_02600 [Rhodococcus sp. T7]QQZ19250.1 hypothetical protein GO592_38120 [Rhodococcus sp. 21391]BAH55766.1 hypothetical protein ROP_pROB01-02670 [Rhodococcus opacus B4]
MTLGVGVTIGTAYAVAATASADHPTESLLTRRSTLTLGPDSTVRLGDAPDGAGVLSEFAHRLGDVLVAGDGRRYAAQDLVAAAAHCVIAETHVAEDTPVVLAHPAVHSAHAVGELRAALDRAGLARVGLVPEPVAALAWFEAEHGPLSDGVALVCDLGADSLDLTIVSGGTNDGSDPIVGRPLRSTEFGSHRSQPTVDELTSALELVADCLDAAGLYTSDLDLVLLTGAETPPGLRERLEGLGAPVTCPPFPGSVSARGAALLAAASRYPIVPPGHTVRRGRGGNLRVVAAVVLAAVALIVPWYASNVGSNARHDDTVVASPPPSQHGFRLVERAAPAPVPSASAATVPAAPATVALTANPVTPIPRMVAVTAPPIPPTLPTSIHPVIDFVDTTIEPSTRKTMSLSSVPSPAPAPAPAPIPESNPVPTTDPDESTPTTEPRPTTEPPATTLPDETETPPAPIDPLRPSDPETPVTPP